MVVCIGRYYNVLFLKMVNECLCETFFIRCAKTFHIWRITLCWSSRLWTISSNWSSFRTRPVKRLARYVITCVSSERVSCHVWRRWWKCWQNFPHSIHRHHQPKDTLVLLPTFWSHNCANMLYCIGVASWENCMAYAHFTVKQCLLTSI